MPELSPQVIDGLHDLISSLAPNLALALSEQFSCEAQLELGEIETVPLQGLMALEETVLHTHFSLSQPTEESVILLSESAARTLADLLDGKDGSDPPLMLTDAQLQKLSAAMNGLTRGLATALTNRTGETVDVESCTTALGTLALPPVFALEGTAVKATMPLTIADVLATELTFLMTPELVTNLVPDGSASEEEEDAGTNSSIISEDELAAMLGELGGGSAAPAPAAPAPAFTMPAPSAPFGAMPAGNTEGALPRGMELILDIPLDVTVELGRVRMLIKDVLELASGSIVELDRVAGEPVDLLVNGRLIAKGEVVVIEDNFGIRITEIISPADRVAGLGKGR